MSKELWFKRRRYGWGWAPVSWKGWLAIGIYLLIVFGGMRLYSPDCKLDLSEDEATLVYVGVVTVATILLAAISYMKGPSPKWRWGKRKDDDPETDY